MYFNLNFPIHCAHPNQSPSTTYMCSFAKGLLRCPFWCKALTSNSSYLISNHEIFRRCTHVSKDMCISLGSKRSNGWSPNYASCRPRELFCRSVGFFFLAGEVGHGIERRVLFIQKVQALQRPTFHGCFLCLFRQSDRNPAMRFYQIRGLSENS